MGQKNGRLVEGRPLKGEDRKGGNNPRVFVTAYML
jgi:hypothetical protein